MKKLLIFAYTLDMGGAEKALVDTINFLHDKCEIDLYLLEKKGALLERVPKDVNVFAMKKNPIQYSLFRFWAPYRKKVINKIANAKDYDIVIGYLEGRCGTWVADINKKTKKIVWVHNDVFKFNIGISDKEAKDTYGKLETIICVSDDNKVNLCKKYDIDPDKVKVIYNYINEDDILKKANEIKLEKSKMTFVNVAAIKEQKRHDRLIKAAKYLKDKGYDFEIQFIGTGPKLEEVKNMVNEYGVSDVINIMGLKPNPYPYVKNADFFVLSSYMEGYCIAVKEALFLKKVVITTDVAGMREMFEGDKYGVIIPNNDDAMKYALEEVLKKPHKYDNIKKNLETYGGSNEKIKLQILELLDLN